jgi:hypothetical protein
VQWMEGRVLWAALSCTYSLFLLGR